MPAPVNEQLHQLLTALDQLSGQPRLQELGLVRPIELLAAALTEQRLELVNAQAGLREVLRISRFLAGALLAMDARHQAGRAPMLPIGTVEELRRWIADGIRDEQDRDEDHTLAPASDGSVNQSRAAAREPVLNSGRAPGTRRGDWSQGSDDQTAAADVGSTPSAQDA